MDNLCVARCKAVCYVLHTQSTGETATLSKGKSTGIGKTNEIECDRQTVYHAYNS